MVAAVTLVAVAVTGGYYCIVGRFLLVTGDHALDYKYIYTSGRVDESVGETSLVLWCLIPCA